MEFIIIFVIAYFIIKAVTKGDSSTSSNSNSTISKVDTGEYISLDEYDIISRNTPVVENTVSVKLVGTIKSFDDSQKIGSIISDNDIYEIIFQRNFNYNNFPNHMPKVDDKVIFQPQMINEKFYASNIEYYRPNIITNICKSEEWKKQQEWRKLKEFISTIEIHADYLEALEMFYISFFFEERYDFELNEMFNNGKIKELIKEFIKSYQLDIKFHISYENVLKDLQKIDKQYEAEFTKNDKSIFDYNSYIEVLQQYYRQYGDEVFLPSKLQKLIDAYQLDSRFGIQSDDVAEDFRNIRAGKPAQPKSKWIQASTPQTQPQDKQIQTTSNTPSAQNRQNTTISNTSSVQAEYKRLDKTGRITTYQQYIDALEQYYIENEGRVFDFSLINSFINKYNLGKYDIEIYEVFADLMNIELNYTYKLPCSQSIEDWLYFFKEKYGVTIKYNGVPCETLLEEIRLGIIDIPSIAPPVQPQRKQPQTTSNTPSTQSRQTKAITITPPVQAQGKQTQQILPTQPQSKRTQTINTTPPVQTQSILDEQKLLNYIKAIPVKWEFGNPDALQNKSLKKLCSAFISSESVSKILNPEMCASMELLIQQKRARNPRAADYNKAMDTNLLYELYKYAYLMATFQVLENRKNDTLKIDRVKFWNLIQTDCHKRLENIEQEKRNNSAVRNMLQKYEFDTKRVKMVVNDYVEPREYDYICASLMTNILLPIIIDYVLDGEINIGSGYQKTLQIIRQYPASDLMAALDASLSSITSFTLGMYANGGRLPR